jgi:ribosomal protein S18 acetylase RimI-like enzyme
MELSDLSLIKRWVVNDAIAAGYAATYTETHVDLVRWSKHEKPRALGGLRIWATGTAFDITLDLAVANGMRSADDMRAVLGLELLRDEEIVGALVALGEDATAERVREVWDAKPVLSVAIKGRATHVRQMVGEVLLDLAHLPIMRECMSIRRGEHPGWSGDRVLNAETFLARFAMRDRARGAALADDLLARPQRFSRELGISPGRVEFYAERLREGVDAALNGTPTAAAVAAKEITPRQRSASLQAQLGVSIYRNDWEPGVGPPGTTKTTYRVREPGGRELAKAIVYRSPGGEYDLSDIGVRDEDRRGRGIGGALIDFVFLDTDAPYLRASTGFTRDGHRFFERYGLDLRDGARAVRRPHRVGPVGQGVDTPMVESKSSNLEM